MANISKFRPIIQSDTLDNQRQLINALAVEFGQNRVSYSSVIYPYVSSISFYVPGASAGRFSTGPTEAAGPNSVEFKYWKGVTEWLYEMQYNVNTLRYTGTQTGIRFWNGELSPSTGPDGSKPYPNPPLKFGGVDNFSGVSSNFCLSASTLRPLVILAERDNSYAAHPTSTTNWISTPLEVIFQISPEIKKKHLYDVRSARVNYANSEGQSVAGRVLNVTHDIHESSLANRYNARANIDGPNTNNGVRENPTGERINLLSLDSLWIHANLASKDLNAVFYQNPALISKRSQVEFQAFNAPIITTSINDGPYS